MKGIEKSIFRVGWTKRPFVDPLRFTNQNLRCVRFVQQRPEISRGDPAVIVSPDYAMLGKPPLCNHQKSTAWNSFSFTGGLPNLPQID